MFHRNICLELTKCATIHFISLYFVGSVVQFYGIDNCDRKRVAVRAMEFELQAESV